MASDHSQSNWQNEIPQDPQNQPPQKDNAFLNMIMVNVGLALGVAVISVVAWEKVVGPTWDYFQPPLKNMASEIGTEAAELQQASDKNCKGTNYNRRGCKSVWANVRIPSLDQTANVSSHVNVPGN